MRDGSLLKWALGYYACGVIVGVGGALLVWRQEGGPFRFWWTLTRIVAWPFALPVYGWRKLRDKW